MGTESDIPEKSWYRIGLGITLSYFGQLMLGYFLAQFLFIRWHRAPADTSPLRHIWNSPEFIMMMLLLLVFFMTTMAFRHMLRPMGMWAAVTHYSRNLPPKKKFVAALWAGAVIVVLVVGMALIPNRTMPGSVTVALMIVLPVVWAIEAMRSYRAWKKGPDTANGGAQ